MVIAYLLLAVLAYIYVRVIFEAWDYKRKQKAEWNKYWDEVFEKNKYL